jgi:hypothetical protein
VKRLSLLILLTALAVGATGCSPGDEAVVTVNDEVVLTQGDWEDEMAELADSDAFLDAFDARGTGGDGTLETGEMSAVLRFHVLAALYEEILEQEDIDATGRDRETATNLLTSDLANPAPESGNAPIDFQDLPERYREVLTDLYASYTAAIRHFGASPEEQDDPNLAEAQSLLGETARQVQLDAEVEIAERYGTWDEDAGNIIVPEGPIAPPADDGG